MRFKRAEITTAQIVTIVILIASFAVILFLFSRLNLGNTTNSEICHNSVVLKAKSSGLASSLDCRTEYVCISGGAECSDINPTLTLDVDSQSREEIMKNVADQMANCWWMFGEGKLNFGDNKLFGSDSCAICATLKFDDSVLRENMDLTYEDFYSYLETTKKDNTQTYLNYLYGTPSLDAFLETYPAIQSKLSENFISEDRKAIVTGYSTSWFGGILSSDVDPVSYVNIGDISSELGCSSFITKS